MTDENALTRILHSIRRAFGSNTSPVVEQAAALAWRRADDGGVEVLLITSRGTGRWVLPKGWIEDGEDKAVAAAREAWEEAGVEGKVAAKPVGTYTYVKTDDDMVQPCHVTVFAMAVATLAEDWPERAERERNWVSPAEAATLVNERDLRSLLASFDDSWTKLAA